MTTSIRSSVTFIRNM